MNKIDQPDLKVQQTPSEPPGASDSGPARDGSPASSGAPAAVPLRPGYYHTPNGKLVEIVGTIVGDQVVYLDHASNRRRVIGGASAREYLRPAPVNKSIHGTPRRSCGWLNPEDSPHGSMRVVVSTLFATVLVLGGVIALFVSRAVF